MKIDLTELLRKAGNEAEVDEEIKVSFPEDGLPLTRPVKVKLHLVNLGPAVSLEGTVETEAEVACSRCGRSFRAPLSARISEEYSKSFPHVSGKEIELKEEDFVYPIGKDDSLDLGETIRQNLLLALPIKTLCEEKCKGR